VLCALLMIAVALAAAADISGKWKGTIDTPMGQFECTYDFVVNGAALTGKVQSTMGSSNVIEGKNDGEKFLPRDALSRSPFIVGRPQFFHGLASRDRDRMSEEGVSCG
jgi:hypothetical protein